MKIIYHAEQDGVERYKIMRISILRDIFFNLVIEIKNGNWSDSVMMREKKGEEYNGLIYVEDIF